MGQSFAMFGNGLQTAALAWLIWRVSGSPLKLCAMYVLATSGSALLFGCFGGVIADRFDRRRFLVIIEAVTMLLAIGLSAAAFTHRLSSELAMGLGMLGGVILALELPSRLCVPRNLLKQEELVGGTAWLTTLGTVQSALGGVATTAVMWVFPNAGASCFAVNAVCHAVALWMLIRRVRLQHAPPKSVAKAGPAECLALAWHSRPVFAVLAQTAVVVLFANRLFALLPMVVEKVLHAGTLGDGMLKATWAVGTIVVGLALSRFNGKRQLLNGVTVAFFFIPLVQIAFATRQSVVTAGICYFGMAIVMSFHGNACNMVIRLEVPSHLQGRVFALRATLVAAIDVPAAVVAGAVAQWWGAQLAIGACACLLCVTGVAMSRLPSFPRILLREPQGLSSQPALG